MIDQHVPKNPPEASAGGGKAFEGPSWRKKAFPSMGTAFGVKVWRVTKVRANGRVIHWRCEDGRVAITEAAPTHPDYPKELTSKHEKADADADAAEAAAAAYTDIY